jgi:FKBP-type peptidyl-prolyl cis-trans isomerase
LSLPDGAVLDRSEDHPQHQSVFRVNRVIPAWHEALLAMRPGALLIFDLDLLNVERAPSTVLPKSP